MARQSLKNICRLIESASSNLPPEQDFLTDLKRSIELSNAKDKRVPSKSYKPSSMNCIRNMYYQVTGTIPDPDDTGYCLVGICNAGTDIHERTQNAIIDMKNNGMDCEWVDVAEFVKSRGLDYLEIKSKNDAGTETKLYHKDLNISFLCDGIIRYKGKYYILELKTESSQKWRTRTDVDPKHYNQGIAYSIAFGIDSVIFVYINRDVLDMKSFMFNVTDSMKMELTSRIISCDTFVENGIVPPKPEELPKSTCEYCSYRKTCSIN